MALNWLQVAMKVLVDNVAVLVIEYCLLDGLSDLLSPGVVLRLDENLIRDIAVETADSQTERAGVLRKLKSLEAGLQTLGRLDIHKPAGTSHLHDSSYL